MLVLQGISTESRIRNYAAMANNESRSSATPSRSRWEKIYSKLRLLVFYVSLWRSRWLWFLTPTNIVGLGFILFIAAVFKQAIPHDVLPRTGLVRYETALDTANIMEMRLEIFERQHMMQQ
ncbi:hypothetical protein COOONC_14846, partial [Cooperia oncophora]